jgi:hypothetical protein
MNANIKDLIGKTLTSIEKENDYIIFTTDTNEKYKMYHEQDCREGVQIEDIEGDLQKLIGNPILQAEKSTNSTDTFGKIENPYSFTWTFYKLATIKEYVTIRWLGESNGYYSESVDFAKADEKGAFSTW